MLYELSLISVVIASGYWGIYFLRNRPRTGRDEELAGSPLFGLMQLGAAIAATIGLAGEGTAAGIAGAIGLGAGACLLVVGPLVRGLARRAAGADRIGLAGRLLDVADALMPGAGVSEEKALLAAMHDIREGRVEGTVEALAAAKQRAPAEAVRVIDERIAMLYLAAYRWQDAIAHAEAHLAHAMGQDAGERSLGGADGDPDASPSLREALGVAPPVWVELLGAYARVGDLDRAARMMERLEAACRGRDDAAIWLHRGRMMFLALAGRPAAVQALLEPRRARHMSEAARDYWVAVAHEHRGDREAATVAYHRAQRRARGKNRELIEASLAKLDERTAVQLSPVASEIVAKLEAAPLPPPVPVVRAHVAWGTWGLTLALVAVAVFVSWVVGPTSDPGVLVRAGAMVRGVVDGGEWWRLVSCLFVHVGTVHLIVNLVGLYVLGRLTEDLFGTGRMLAIYGGSGLAGAIASYLMSPVPVSAGASGAIFGVLGAMFIELTLHRERYRAAWKRGMWGALVVVTVAQVGVGFLYPVIDQWAHGAGLAGGVVLGALLSPSVRWARAGRIAGAVLGLAFGGLALAAGVQVARTSIADSLDRGEPRVRFELGELAITAPQSWMVRGDLVDPDGLVIVSLAHATAGDLPLQVAEWAVRGLKNARERGFDHVEVIPSFVRAVPLPPDWEGAELVASVEDALGHDQRYRVVSAGKIFGDRIVLVWLFVPETVAYAAPELFTDLVATIQPR